jgi:glycosyltransferase involved in cell wall biosynthesis
MNTGTLIQTGEQPLISVGVLTYRRPESLRRTLESLISQSYRNLEIIVSDNASPENEVNEVMNEFMGRDARVRCYRQPENIGATLNAQFVLDKAKGEYFMWSSDDDWHDPEFVEALFKGLASNCSAIFAFCYFDMRTEAGEEVGGYPCPERAMKAMTGGSRFLRQLRFFLMPEGTSIPHAMYGLIRREKIAGLLWRDFLRRYGEYGADTLFIFWLLGLGRFVLVERKLFGCTVNNKKFYGSVQKRSFSKRLSTATQRIRYVFSFVKIAGGWSRLAVACVLPVKLAELFYSMLIREPMRRISRTLRGLS